MVSVWSDFRQCNKSALTPRRSFPPIDYAGGAAWFSWEKNWSRSPIRYWHAIYNLEKRLQALFTAVSCICCFDCILVCDRLKSGILFLGSVSVTGFVHRSSLSSTRFVYCSSPRYSISITVSATGVSMISLVSRNSHLLKHCYKCSDILQKGCLYSRFLVMVKMPNVVSTAMSSYRLLFKRSIDPGYFWPCHHPVSECPRVSCQSNSSTRPFDHSVVLFMTLVNWYGREQVAGLVYHKHPRLEFCQDIWVFANEVHHVTVVYRKPPGIVSVI